MSYFTHRLRATHLTSRQIANILGITWIRAVKWMWDRDIPSNEIVQDVIIRKLNSYE